MTETIYFVAVEGELCFASFEKYEAEAYAGTYNSNAIDEVESEYGICGDSAAYMAGYESGVAEVVEAEVPIVTLSTMDALCNRYTEDEIKRGNPIYLIEFQEKVLLGEALLNINGKQAVDYANTTYIYLEDDGEWFELDTLTEPNTLLPLDAFDEKELHSYLNVDWSDGDGEDDVLITTSMGDRFTRGDVYTACTEYLAED